MSEIRQIHEPLARWLREQDIEFIRARSDKRSTIEVGLPDFCLLHPLRGPLWLEAKTDKGKLSPAQKAVHARLKERGFVVLVIRSMSAAVEAVTEWQAQAPLPADKPAEQLYRYGQAVYRPNGNRNDFVRLVQPEDMALPSLSSRIEREIIQGLRK